MYYVNVSMDNIFINKNTWKQFDIEQLTSFKSDVFNHYRTYGFPYFETSKEYREKEFEKLKKYDAKNLIDNDVVNQTMHGLGLAWSYFPHNFEINCNNKLSPMEAFLDDNIFKKVIEKRIRIGDNMSDNGIRKMLKIFSNVQSVSNFRPTAAAAIYERYGKDKVVLDMSCGFGGRLLGAIVSGVKEYIGLEPSSKTFEGLQKMCDDFAPQFKNTIYKIGSEEFIPEKESIDLCFTSPPYFDTEKYSDEPTQSYLKYPSKDEWMNGFMRKTLENCFYGLKDDGYLIVNIANVKNYKTLETDFIDLAMSIGFELDIVMKLSLSSMTRESKYKYEPIFVFKKH